ncbi:MAG TPA: DUF4055 domain-containing protein [Bryobacteraceae bacterium]|nr:DUF4055 domain-containing protein [Bryobacteraceae bacterium]
MSRTSACATPLRKKRAETPRYRVRIMDNINREHPEYEAKKKMWKKYRDLYSGGEQLRERATEYLIPRNKEPDKVYSERVSRVYYENYIGSIIDWYSATLLRREPVLTVSGANESGRQFFNEFAEDCDLKGTSLSDFFRQQLVNTLVFGKAYVALEFPRFSQPAPNRAEEDASGRSRAFLVEYSADEVINWSYGSDGTPDWIVMRTSCLRQEKVTDPEWKRETRWIYYDREDFRIYSSVEGRDGEAGAIRLADEGKHGLAAQRRVPVFQLKVTDGLWLMNKAALLQLEHFNKSNALSWALTMGLFATPVVYSDREWNQIVGEGYFIQLSPEDKFGWTEPEGHVFKIAAENLDRLKDEIYRVCYLIAQAAGPQASVAQSGLSKQRDFSITQEVLRAYGDAVKETIKQTLRAIETARQDGLAIDVSGLDEFDIGDFSNELDDARKLLEIGIESETLKKQLFKKLALKYFCDARQEIKTTIAGEIDASFEQGKRDNEG